MLRNSCQAVGCAGDRGAGRVAYSARDFREADLRDCG